MNFIESIRNIILSVIITLILFSSVVSAEYLGPGKDDFDTMVHDWVQWNDENFEDLAEDKFISTLMNLVGNQTILLTVNPDNFASLICSNGRIIDYKIGEKLPEVTLEIEMDQDTFDDFYYAEGYNIEVFTSNWMNGNITMKPISTKMKIVNTGLNIYKFTVNLFS